MSTKLDKKLWEEEEKSQLLKQEPQTAAPFMPSTYCISICIYIYTIQNTILGRNLRKIF